MRHPMNDIIGTYAINPFVIIPSPVVIPAIKINRGFFKLRNINRLVSTQKKISIQSRSAVLNE